VRAQSVLALQDGMTWVVLFPSRVRWGASHRFPSHFLGASKIRHLAGALALPLGGCGGGSDAASSYAELSAQARQLQATATTLAIDTPCQHDVSCSVLVFAGACSDLYAPLSLASPNANQALLLSGEQRKLIDAAVKAPDFVVPPCAPPPPSRPAAGCVEAQCALR
jgi:hypothetical protein